jgi:hypothetical protein
MSKRNNESTQQNRRIVRWSRRHVQAAGMSVKTVDPLPNQTLELSKHAKASTTKNSVVVCRKPHSTPVLSSKRTPDVGSIFFSNGDNFGVGYSDVDGSVAAMKAHLEKYIINTKDPNTCIRCERVDKGSVVLFRQRGSKCYVKACYSSGSYDCPVSVGLICQTYRLSDPIAPHQSGSRLRPPSYRG